MLSVNGCALDSSSKLHSTLGRAMCSSSITAYELQEMQDYRLAWQAEQRAFRETAVASQSFEQLKGYDKQV